jgi:hypothetical protein
MQATGQFFGGGILVALWTKIGAAGRAVILVAITAIVASEITMHVNTAIYSGQVKAGEGIQGTAQVVDPNKSLDAYHDRRPVSGAEALMGASVAEKAATASKLGSESDAMAESIDDIRGKMARGISITTTEQLQLVRVETALAELKAKEGEARQRAAEAKIKEAEATAADQKAAADKAISKWISCTVEHNGIYGTNNLFNDPCARLRPF